MKPEHAKLSPYQRAKRWYETERAMIEGRAEGPNEFAPYVPVEARDEVERMREKGITPRFTNNHFMLWAALTEIMGEEEFKEPFSWTPEDTRTHLLGATGG